MRLRALVGPSGIGADNSEKDVGGCRRANISGMEVAWLDGGRCCTIIPCLGVDAILEFYSG